MRGIHGQFSGSHRPLHRLFLKCHIDFKLRAFKLKAELRFERDIESSQSTLLRTLVHDVPHHHGENLHVTVLHVVCPCFWRGLTLQLLNPAIHLSPEPAFHDDLPVVRDGF